MWTKTAISIDVIDDLSDHPVATLIFHTPEGQITAMAEPIVEGSKLILRRCHIGGASANIVGHANLRVVAQVMLERLHYDELIVEGAIRTTGANPGRQPRPIRFPRNVRS